MAARGADLASPAVPSYRGCPLVTLANGMRRPAAVQVDSCRRYVPWLPPAGRADLLSAARGAQVLDQLVPFQCRTSVREEPLAVR